MAGLPAHATALAWQGGARLSGASEALRVMVRRHAAGGAVERPSPDKGR